MKFRPAPTGGVSINCITDGGRVARRDNLLESVSAYVVDHLVNVHVCSGCRVVVVVIAA